MTVTVDHSSMVSTAEKLSVPRLSGCKKGKMQPVTFDR